METFLLGCGLLLFGSVIAWADDAATSKQSPPVVEPSEPVKVPSTTLKEYAKASRLQEHMNRLLKNRDTLNAEITALQKEIDEEGAVIKNLTAPAK